VVYPTEDLQEEFNALSNSMSTFIATLGNFTIAPVNSAHFRQAISGFQESNSELEGFEDQAIESFVSSLVKDTQDMIEIVSSTTSVVYFESPDEDIEDYIVVLEFAKTVFANYGQGVASQQSIKRLIDGLLTEAEQFKRQGNSVRLSSQIGNYGGELLPDLEVAWQDFSTGYSEALNELLSDYQRMLGFINNNLSTN